MVRTHHSKVGLQWKMQLLRLKKNLGSVHLLNQMHKWNYLQTPLIDRNFSCFDIGEVPRSHGKLNWNWLSFLPFISFLNNVNYKRYHKVASSKPVYYPILISLSQRSQYLRIKFLLHKQFENAWVCNFTVTTHQNNNSMFTFFIYSLW